MSRRSESRGALYLLHLDPPYRHAGHYLGFVPLGSADDEIETIARRVSEHAEGVGSPLVAAAVASGCEVIVARTWPDATRRDERAIKNGHGLGRFCPLCVAAYNDRCAVAMRRSRKNRADRAARAEAWVRGARAAAR